MKKSIQRIWQTVFGSLFFASAYSIMTGGFPETWGGSFKLAVVGVLVLLGVEIACRLAMEDEKSDG